MKKTAGWLVAMTMAVAIFYVAVIALAVSGIRVVVVPNSSDMLLVTGHPDMPFVMDPRILCIQEHRGGDKTCRDGKMEAILRDGNELYKSSSPIFLNIGRFLDSLP